MLKLYFGDVREGWLNRADYIRASLLLIVIGGNAIIGGWQILMTLAEMSGTTTARLAETSRWGAMAFGLYVLIATATGLAYLNILVKRARHMGFSGLTFALGAAAAAAVIARIGHPVLALALAILGWPVAMAIPGGRFGPPHGRP